MKPITDDELDDLYVRVESLSKSLEGSSRVTIDTSEDPTIYLHVLQLMELVQAERARREAACP